MARSEAPVLSAQPIGLGEVGYVSVIEPGPNLSNPYQRFVLVGSILLPYPQLILEEFPLQVSGGCRTPLRTARRSTENAA